MRSKFLSQIFTDIPLTLIGLVLFFSAFVALFSWVYLRKGARRHYDEMAALPLIDGESHGQ